MPPHEDEINSAREEVDPLADVNGLNLDESQPQGSGMRMVYEDELRRALHRAYAGYKADAPLA